MEFDEAIRTAKNWLSGERETRGCAVHLLGTVVTLIQSYTEIDLAAFEANWELAIPQPYRRLLLEVGAFHIVVPTVAPAGGIEFFRIDEVCARVAASSQYARQRVYSHCLPIGRAIDAGHFLVVATDAAGPENFARVNHVPSDWGDLRVERKQLHDFGKWFGSLLDTVSAGGSDRGISG